MILNESGNPSQVGALLRLALGFTWWPARSDNHQTTQKTHPKRFDRYFQWFWETITQPFGRFRSTKQPKDFDRRLHSHIRNRQTRKIDSLTVETAGGRGSSHDDVSSRKRSTLGSQLLAHSSLRPLFSRAARRRFSTSLGGGGALL